jgi:phospholipid transport system substrate-binding protein
MNSLFVRRRWFLAVTAGATVITALPARAGEPDSVSAPIQRLVDSLLSVMKAGTSTPFTQRYATLAPVIDSTFDLSTILRDSVGASWASLPPDQQTMLEDAFRKYTVSSYVNSFDTYKGQQFVVQPDTRSVANGERVVQTQIIPKSGEKHELDYVMRDGPGGWRAVDVLADGAVSRVAVQRSDFRRLLTRGGAQALAESLRTKSADLSSGSG